MNVTDWLERDRQRLPDAALRQAVETLWTKYASRAFEAQTAVPPPAAPAPEEAEVLLQDMEAELLHLVSLVRRYGRHAWECGVRRSRPCSCGFDEVIGNLPTPEEDPGTYAAKCRRLCCTRGPALLARLPGVEA